LVYIVSRFPFPLEKGDKLRAYYQIRELSKSFNLHLIALTENVVSESHIHELEKFCASVTTYKISKFSSFLSVFFALFTKKPLQVGYFFNFLVNHKIQKQLESLKPNHIFTQLIRTSEYSKNYHNCPKTIDYMDALSKGIERRTEKVGWYSRWIFKLEARRLMDYERTVFDYYEFKVIISEQDRNYIFHPESAKIKCVPNGIDETFLTYVSQVEPTFDLVFLGNMSYAPNVDTAKYICKELLPNLPHLRLLIAGANPHPSLLKLTKSNKTISLSGWIDDARKAYVSGKLFLAPMLIGTGMQNKLLEAMALGIPCITSTLANNAIKAIHMKSIVIADTKEELIEAIELLLADAEKSKEIGFNGKEFVRSNYSWEKVCCGLVTKD
jgi:glycosyltransferase involved in cell wall biosynthesis